jgi:hypothetical protein
MSKTQIGIFLFLCAAMVGSAYLLGNWADQLNPEGIAPHPAAEGNTEPVDTSTRDAFAFGVSMGLLGSALLYCCIAFGLFIQAKSQRKSVGVFVYWVAGLAGLGFALSYLIDDYFY